jgi:hypothetical protein
VAQLYDRPVRVLMHDMVREIGLRPSDIIDRDQVTRWFAKRFPLVKEGTIAAHLIRLSTNAPSRLHYSPKPKDDDLFFQLESGRFRLYDSATDPAPIAKDSSTAVENTRKHAGVDDATTETSEFAYERDLRNFLSKNLSLLEPGLQLYEDEGINGIEFPVGGRFIDILAIDKHGAYVVVELKVSRGYDRVIGQLLRYMGWIEQHHAEAGRRVRGAIVAKEISEDLLLAARRIADVALFEYELSVQVRLVAPPKGTAGAA